ncbi:alpha/beta hydrolase, partial [Pyxidicoccus fallax]
AGRAGTAEQPRTAEGLVEAPPFTGGWLRPDGGLVHVGHDGVAPFLMDFASRRRWRLEPREDGAWALAGSQPAARITWNGSRPSLTGLGPAPLVLERLPARTEDVTVRNGGVTLAGTLWLPAGTPPRAGVVLLPDADMETRRALEPYPSFLVHQGLAVLTYDRRGSGGSTGNGRPWVSGMDVLAEDGLAAARLLRERAGLREGAVGLMGFGQGAWAAVHAASRAPELTGFLVLVSGGGGPLWKQEQHRLRNEARRKGLTGPELVELTEFLGVLHDARLYAPEREEKSLRTLDFHLKRAKRRRWYAVTPQSRHEELPLPGMLELQRLLWSNVLSYDPAEDLGRVRGPVLALLGEKDEVTPARPTASALSAALSQADSDVRAGTVTVKVLAGADHRLVLPADAKQPGVETMAEELFPSLEAWLRGLGR